MFTAIDIYYQYVVSNFGFVGWLVVGMLWHDRALIVLNSISLKLIYSMGIINYYYG